MNGKLVTPTSLLKQEDVHIILRHYDNWIMPVILSNEFNELVKTLLTYSIIFKFLFHDSSTYYNKCSYCCSVGFDLSYIFHIFKILSFCHFISPVGIHGEIVSLQPRVRRVCVAQVHPCLISGKPDAGPRRAVIVSHIGFSQNALWGVEGIVFTKLHKMYKYKPYGGSADFALTANQCSIWEDINDASL